MIGKLLPETIFTMLGKQQLIVEKGKDIFYRLKPKLEKQFQSGYYVTIVELESILQTTKIYALTAVDFL